MKFTKALFLLLFLGAMHVHAQEIKIDSVNKINKNIVKINLIGFSINGQYERLLGKRISISLSYKVLPSGKFLFRGLIPVADPQARESLNNLVVSNSAITPELRFYVGKKGYGRGFYIAPFFRSANYTGSGIKIDFTLDNGQPSTFNMEGNFKSNTYGLMLGAQWKLGKRIWLDWQILGPHYGRATGNITGMSSASLSATEQTNLANALRDIDIPLTTETVTVKANQATLGLTGPWAGLRTGLSLGIGF